MEKPSREELDTRCISHVRIARGTRPDLKLIEMDGRTLVLKDYRHTDPLFRKIVGPLLIRRELGALRKLAGVEGIPRLHGALDKHALLIERIDGTPLRQLKHDTMGADFYAQLQDLVRRMHAAGVAHCDLRTGGNVLVGKDGRPYIIDFASSVLRGRGLNPVINLIFSEFRRADRFAVLFAKKRFSPSCVTPEEQARLARSLPFERPAIFIGKSIRKLTRRALTRSSK